MNSRFHLRQLKQTAIIMLLLLVSCTDEHVTPDTPGGNTELPDGRVVYTIHTTTPQFERPATRSGQADEDNVSGDLWVFVFDATAPNPDDGLFLEAVKTSDHESAAGGASKRTVILNTRAHKVTLLVVDNAPATYFNGTTYVAVTDAASWGLTATTKLSDARPLLNTVRLASPSVNSVPYTPSMKIPLSAEISRDKLDASTDFGTVALPLGLKRVVARLIVKKDFTSIAGNANTPPFTLKGATVYNTPCNASLFPVHKSNAGNLTNYIGTGAGNEITGIAAAVSDDTATNPIYLYPSEEADAANQPFVIIQAQFNTDTEDTYYKLSIAPKGKPAGQVDRNTDYRFLIKSCTGRGYATLADAIAAPASNLIYTVEVSDLSSHDIIDNGQYYIALSNSEYHFHAYNSFSNLPVATLYTGTNPGAAPFTGVVSITSSDPVNLIVESPTIAHPATNATIRAAVTKEFTQGTLTLRLGNLTKTIRMVRTGSSFITGDLIVNDTYKGPKYKVASVETPRPWIKLGISPAVTLANGQDMVATNNDGVYIAYNANMAKPDLENSVYISTADNGRIKAHFLLSPLEYIDTNAPGNINKDGKNLGGSTGQWDFHFLNPSGYNYTLALFPDEGTVNKHMGEISTDGANTPKKLEYSHLVVPDEDRALLPRLLVAKYKVGDYWYETPYYVQQRWELKINILTVGYNGIDYHRTDYTAPTNNASKDADKALYGIQVGASVNIGCQYSDGIGRLLYRQTGPGKPIEMPIQMYNLCYNINSNAGTANYNNDRVLNALSTYNIDILVCFVHGTNFNGPHGPSQEQAQDIIDKWLLKSKYRGMLYTCDALDANKGWTQAIFGQGQGYSNTGGALTRLATTDPYYHHPVYRSIMSGSYSRYENYPEASGLVLYGSDVTEKVGTPANSTYVRNSSLDPVIGLRDPSIAFFTPVTYGYVPLSLVNEKGFIPLLYHTGTTNVTLAVHPDKRIIFQGELQYYQAAGALNADGSLQATGYGPFPKMMMNMWEWFFNNVALGKKY